MQYMLLIYNAPGGWESMSAEQQQEVYAAYGTFTEELRARREAHGAATRSSRSRRRPPSASATARR